MCIHNLMSKTSDELVAHLDECSLEDLCALWEVDEQRISAWRLVLFVARYLFFNGGSCHWLR